jgi:hypothetical protein
MKYGMVRLDEVDDSPASWLIGGVLTGFSVLYGEPGCGKSFLAINWGVCVAAGVSWCGNDVTQGPVVYIVGEGGQSNMARRIRAAAHHQGVGVRDFYIIPSAVPIPKEDTIEDIRETIGGVKPALVVIDTLSRCFGGENENQQDTMGAFVRTCDAIQEEYGCCVLAIHHTNKSGGLRGSTVLPAAADAIIELRKEGKASIHKLALRAEKLKDGDVGTFEPKELLAEKVTCKDSYGIEILDNFDNPIETLVLTQTQTQTRIEEVEAAFEVLWAIHGPHMTVTTKQWHEQLPDMPNRSINRYIKRILEKGTAGITRVRGGQFAGPGAKISVEGPGYHNTEERVGAAETAERIKAHYEEMKVLTGPTYEEMEEAQRERAIEDHKRDREEGLS